MQPLRSVPTTPVEPTGDPVAAWLSTFTNRTTVTNYGRDLRILFAATGAVSASDLTDGAILQWANGNGRLANKTVRARLTAAISFLRWCRENDLPALDPSRIARLARRYPKVYGKVQGHRPARWLTREEAYGRLVPACQDGTELGLRDELAIRLGLAGIRAAEIGSLRIGYLALSHTPPTIDWTGKARRPRHATIGREMLAVIHRYLAAYEAAIGRPLRPSDPFLCRRLPGGKRGSRLMWGPWLGRPRSERVGHR